MRRHELLLLTVVLALSSAEALAASPKWIRLSWASPDASESMAITWNSGLADAKTQVEYGKTSALGSTATGTSFTANGKIGTVHEVELVGLAPDTTYYYRVGGPGDWSDVYAFRTAPLPGCGPMSFIVLGDGRSQDTFGPAPQWPSIYEQALGEEPDFIIDTGDLVKDGEDDVQWVNYLDKTAPLLPLAPHMPCLGNHDDDKQDGDYANFNQVFQLPRNETTETEDYYYFTHGDAIFVALSTSTYTGGAIKFQDQAAWLDKVLTENPRKWKFVYFHHPPYTSFGEALGFKINHEPNEVQQNAALVPVFDKHHVDIVFTGHNHFYERFSAMYGGGGSDKGNPVSGPDKGTVYIITGGAGAFTYDFELGDIKLDLMGLFICNGISQAPGSQVCSGRHHYVTVTIDGNELKGEVIATAAQNFDTNTKNIEVLDTFAISKNEPLTVCEATPPVVPDPDPDPDAGATDAGGSDAGQPGEVVEHDGGGAKDIGGGGGDASADVAGGGDLATADTLEPPADASAGEDDAAGPGGPSTTDTGGGGPGPGGGGWVPGGAEPDAGSVASPEKKTGSKDSGCTTGGGLPGGVGLLLAGLAAVAIRRRPGAA